MREACDRLLGAVTLDDLTAFITVARLTEESGVSSGAIYSAVDGGGDRSATVAALPRIIAHYKAQGARFISLCDPVGVG